MRRYALGAAVALIAIVVGVAFVPFLDRARPLVAGTPSPKALFSASAIPVGAGRSACLSGVTITTRSQEASFALGSKSATPPLTLTLAGGGYADTVHVPAGKPAGTDLRIPIRPPARDVEGRVCIRNDSRRHAIALVGTREQRTQSRPLLSVGGKPLRQADVALAFYQDGSASIASRLGLVLQRMEAFRPAFLPEPILWILLILAFAGVPLATLYAIARALPRE